jgi:hypothetical protein
VATGPELQAITLNVVTLSVALSELDFEMDRERA